MIRPADFSAFIAANHPVVLVEIAEARGSTPREAGALMLVSAKALLGTIGGGQLEYMAIDEARRMIARAEARAKMDVPLGPEIGQCCGGRVDLTLTLLDGKSVAALRARLLAAAKDLPHVYLFGGGHVGRALAQALAPLPLRTIVVETRSAELDNLPAGTESRLTALPESIVRAAPAGSAFVIFTHDHALDFLIAAEALQRTNAAYVGMIGSATKRARFHRYFKVEGGDPALLTRLVCPIGGDSVHDKRPEVIAALTAAELLRHIDRAAPAQAEKSRREAAGMA
jgi:xanthine dehydrogenase accessory factor